ncbi:MAG: TonB-dependent receptor plug domain-containing protein [Parvularculaceae bacterium]
MKTSVCALAALLAAPGAFAQSPPQGETNDEIIVTGTKLPTPIDQVGRSVDVISGAEIEIRQQRFLTDALGAAPGVQIIRSGTFGALASVSLRGLPSGQTLLVQDGIVLNDPVSFQNGFNFANFSTDDVARIEVLRGAQSTLYGSDAIGGVVNVVTKDGREGFGGSAFLEGGSFDTVRGGASLYGGGERASGRISASAVTTNGFSSADEANGNVEDDGFDNLTVSSKGRVQATANLELDAVIRFQDSEVEFDGFDFAAGGPVDAGDVALTEELSLAGSATHRAFGGALESRARISFLRNDQTNLSDANPFDAQGTRASYEYQATVRPAAFLTLVAGAEYDQQRSRVDAGFGATEGIDTISGFGLVQARAGSFLTLNAGVRHDTSEDFGGETTFSASAAFAVPVTGTILRASYSEGFRAPTASELSFNPDLFAEFSDGFDAGIEQPLFDDRLRLRATYFDQSIDDLIAFDLTTFNFLNVQTFRSEGVEASLDARPADWLSIKAAYTYTDATNVSLGVVAGGQPDHRVNAELAAMATRRLSLSVGVTYNGEEEIVGQTLDAFTLVNLRAAFAARDGLELFARVENALDADYQDNVGFGTAPVSAFGGVRATF